MMAIISYEEVRALLADHFSSSPQELSPETRLVDDLYADSLELLDLVMNLNALYGIEIEATDLQQMRTVADVVQVLQRLTREDQQPAA